MWKPIDLALLSLGVILLSNQIAQTNGKWLGEGGESGTAIWDGGKNNTKKCIFY